MTGYAPAGPGAIPLDIRQLLCAALGASAEVREAGAWLVVVPAGATTGPQQGWKLHVSADAYAGGEVLRRCLPVLRDHRAPFKVAASADVLAQLNIGVGGLSQIGKFLTVYPADDASAVRLARDLDAATRGLSAPSVPSDRALRPGSLVHYRYGGFGDRLLQLPDGTVAPALLAPSGELVPDERTASFSPPAWARDPFPPVDPPERRLDHALGASRAGAYRVLALLAESGRGSVFLGVDLVGRRRCVFKTTPRTPDQGQAERALRGEASVLRDLPDGAGGPALYDFLELDDQLVLVMEDIPGPTLAEYLTPLVDRGRLPEAAWVVRVGSRLAAALAGLHEAGLVYRDLKSSNVVVTGDDTPRLLDFELAAPPGTGPSGVGTRGYLSPQQGAGGPSCSADDVYGLGALLYLMTTGADPCRAPHPRDLLGRPPESINPNLPDALATLVTECLDADPAGRPPDMRAVAARLGRIGSAWAPRGVTSPSTAREERCREAALRLGDTLCEDAVEEGDGVTWISTAPATLPIAYRQVNNGAPGVVLALAELTRAFGVDRHRETLEGACRWLAASAPIPGARIPGLYAGEAGVVAALLRAGQALGREQWVDAARAREEGLRELPFGMPDLFHGTAGRLRCAVMLWHHTGDPAVLGHAEACADALLAQADVPAPGRLCWTVPEGHGSYSGMCDAGYAHGAAGVADALLDLHGVTGDVRLADAVAAAARWIESQAVTALPDGSGLDWGNRGGFSGLWCYGASGVGRLFLRLADAGLDDGAAEIAVRAGRTAALAGRHAGSSLCHGLSGSIDYLLDLHRVTGNEKWRRSAWHLEALLQAFRADIGGRLRWLSDDGDDRGNTAYMVGFAGVAVTLLRLWQPDRFASPFDIARTNDSVGSQRSTSRLGQPTHPE